MLAVFRPVTGRFLAGVIIGGCGIAVIAAWIAISSRALIEVGPWLGVAGVVAWAAYWNPRLIVGDDQLVIVNVWRTIAVPWSAVRGVETKWSLVLDTDAGRITAWAVPAPRGTAPIPPADTATGPSDAHAADAMPDASTVSAARPPVVHRFSARFAAATVRDRFERHTVTARPRRGDGRAGETPTVTRRWHLAPMITLVVLAAIGLAAAF